MNKKKFLIAGICLALVAVLLISAVSIVHANDTQTPEEIVVEETGDAQYRFSYVRVGGTDEEPIYQLVIEVIGDEPLVIQGGTIFGGEMEGEE